MDYYMKKEFENLVEIFHNKNILVKPPEMRESVWLCVLAWYEIKARKTDE